MPSSQMLSPRRGAQLGLGIACLILVSSVAVLVAGAADSSDTKENTAISNVTPATPANNSSATAHSSKLLTEKY